MNAFENYSDEDANYSDDGWSVEVAAARHEAHVLSLGEADEVAYRDAQSSATSAPTVAPYLRGEVEPQPF